MEQYSKQREAILANLRARKDHPSADKVYEDLRREHPNISLGTVYRNLTTLAEKGVILRLSEHDKDYFDGDTSPHAHFFCRQCGKIYDVFQAFPEKYIKDTARRLNCKIEEADITMRGVCAECAEKYK